MIKIALLHLSQQNYEQVKKLVLEMYTNASNETHICPTEIKNKPTNLIKYTPSQHMQIISLEIQLYTQLNNFPLLQKIHDHSKNCQIFDFCNSFDAGIIKNLSGKIHLKRNNFGQALRDFFEAFKNFDEYGSELKITALKFYMVNLMLFDSDIYPFDSQETKSYENHPALAEISNLYEFYRKDLTNLNFDQKLESCLENFRREDKQLAFYLKKLQVKLWYKNFLRLVENQEQVSLEFLKDNLKISADKIQLLIVHAICENNFPARYDAVNEVLKIENQNLSDLETNQKCLYKMLEVYNLQADKIQENLSSF